MVEPQPLLLVHRRSPGDIVCLTGAVRDLSIAYPGRFAIHVGGSCSELWTNNPHIAGNWGTAPPRNLPFFRVSYQSYLVQANNERLHFLTAFHRAISDYLEMPVPVLQPHGDLHLTMQERSDPLVDCRYWLFIAGGKSDIRTKIWPAAYSQRLVDLLADQGIVVVQGGAVLPGHHHPKLTGVQSLVGKTDLRDFLRLIYHAEGIICPVTFAMHAAAAFQKPCVVIAGGREPWWWEAYCNASISSFGQKCRPVSVPHRFLHTQGTLDCCRDGGCWKTQLPSGSQPGDHDCLMASPMKDGLVVPACLSAIEPHHVVDAVVSYYADTGSRHL